jgi:hypothetical protein
VEQLRKEEVLAPIQVLCRYLLEELRKTGKILYKGGWCGHRSAFHIHSEMSPLGFLEKCANKRVQISPVGADGHVCVSDRK